MQIEYILFCCVASTTGMLVIRTLTLGELVAPLDDNEQTCSIKVTQYYIL